MNDREELIVSRRLIEEMNRYYDARVIWHDIYMGYKSNEEMESLLRPIIEILEPEIAGKDVLEIACGTGNWTQVLAKRARSVLAIDISAKATEAAQRKNSGNENVAFRVCDAYVLHGIEPEFDVAFAADWWSHIPKSMIPSFIRNLHAKLIPGSKVILIDMCLKDAFEREFSHYDMDGNRIGKRKLPDGREFEVVKNFPTAQEMKKLLSSQGRDVVFRDFDSLKRWLVMYETA
jgi:SAM-dependent methyltransferase